MSEFGEQLEFHDLEMQLQTDFAPSAWQDVRTILAVSGGADSVALLRAMVACRPTAATGDLHVIHVNHGWREEQSDGDQQFVEQLCDELGLACHAVSRTSEVITEELARNQRYEVFLEKARQLGARYVLTAHTQNDQVETLIDRVFRGTGLAGLRGIPRTRQLDHGITLLRPLLNQTRASVLAYLKQLGQLHREDSSNQSSEFTRNRIRNELIPLLKTQYHAGADQAILRLRETAIELSDYLATKSEPIAERAVISCADHQVVLDCTAFRGVASVEVRQALLQIWQQAGWPRQDMTRGHWLQLETLVSKTSEPLTLPGNVRAEKNGEQLSLTRR